jgi:hypothetical protein
MKKVVSKQLRYFKFKGGPSIIAPKKCGTRFMENQTCYPKAKYCSFDIEDIEKYITKNTIFVYRDVIEHMLSGLITDFGLNCKDHTLNDHVNQYLSGNGIHWSSNLYLKLYPIWNKVGFKFIELKDLSTLFKDEVHDYRLFEHRSLVGINNLTDIIKFIPQESRNSLMELAGWDSFWLSRMLQGEKDIIPMSDYVELKTKYELLLNDYNKLQLSIEG